MGAKLLLKNCLPPRVKEVFAAVDQQAAWEAWRLHAKHKQTANVRADEGNPGCTADSGPGRAAPAWPGLVSGSLCSAPLSATNPMHSDRQGLPPGPGLLKWGEGSAAAAPRSREPLRSPGPF